MKEKECYEILGLSEHASWWSIKRAFRRLAKRYHPDLSIENEEKFKTITEAYNTLKSIKYHHTKNQPEVSHARYPTKWISDVVERVKHWAQGFFSVKLENSRSQETRVREDTDVDTDSPMQTDNTANTSTDYQNLLKKEEVRYTKPKVPLRSSDKQYSKDEDNSAHQVDIEV